MTNSDTYHQLIFILLQSVPLKSHQLVFNEKCLLHISPPKDVLTVRINKLSSERICTKNSLVLTPLLLFFFYNIYKLSAEIPKTLLLAASFESK